MKLTVLSGGIGGARFLRGVRAAFGAPAVTAVVNTGDDEVFHGLHVSPDLDSVVYALAGEADPVRGWGLRDESFRALEALRRFDPGAWFQLGDRDLGTHLFRTAELARGVGLAAITRAVASALGVAEAVLPMTEDRVRTRIRTDGGWLSMQEFHVRERSAPPVREVCYEGAGSARPAPGVSEAIAGADVVLIGPSNPVVSIGPILAVPGIRRALEATPAPVVAVSGLRGGKPFRGDADRLLAGLGLEASPRSVAELYDGLLSGFVVDDADAALVPDLEGRGLAVRAMDTALDPSDAAAEVARASVALAGAPA